MSLLGNVPLNYCFLLLALVYLSTAAPVFSLSHLLYRETNTQDHGDAYEPPGQLLRTQLRNPKETLAVLLIIGGDIVQKAIAQMSGAMFIHLQLIPKKRRNAGTEMRQTPANRTNRPTPARGEPRNAEGHRSDGEDIRSMLMWGVAQTQRAGIHTTTPNAPIREDIPNGPVGPEAGQDDEEEKKPWRKLRWRFVPMWHPYPDVDHLEDATDRRLGIAPVAFSFGWVGYAFSSLMSVFGEGLLMPDTDIESLVINLDSGTKKHNQSWVLGRMVRDLGIYHARNQKIRGSRPEPSVHFYRTLPGAGHPKLGRLWWSSIMIPIQFIIASAPVWESSRQPDIATGQPDRRNWLILMITAIGTGLALLTGSIPQWHIERFPARRNTKQHFILTKGNGHVVSFVILNAQGTRRSMNLEDLAIVRPEVLSSIITKISVPILALCWVVLLLCVGGLDRDTWYLFGVGLAGMVQNVIVASWYKHPKTHGIPVELLKSIEDVKEHKLMTVLKHAELVRPNTGIRLKQVFFKDTTLRPDEKAFWDRQINTLRDREGKRARQHNDLLNLPEEIGIDVRAAQVQT